MCSHADLNNTINTNKEREKTAIVTVNVGNPEAGFTYKCAKKTHSQFFYWCQWVRNVGVIFAPSAGSDPAGQGFPMRDHSSFSLYDNVESLFK